MNVLIVIIPQQQYNKRPRKRQSRQRTSTQMSDIDRVAFRVCHVMDELGMLELSNIYDEPKNVPIWSPSVKKSRKTSFN